MPTGRHRPRHPSAGDGGLRSRRRDRHPRAEVDGLGAGAQVRHCNSRQRHHAARRRPDLSMWDGKEKRPTELGSSKVWGATRTRRGCGQLAGDSSDNILGVPGIGIKTAATLLATYDSMAELLERVDEVKGKRGENLRNFKRTGLAVLRIGNDQARRPGRT